jgi:hypothetical protein
VTNARAEQQRRSLLHGPSCHRMRPLTVRESRNVECHTTFVIFSPVSQLSDNGPR